MIAGPGSATRADRLLPFMLGSMVLAVGLWAMHPYAVGVFHDDGVYAILGKSIATGQGYRFLHLPGAPAATHYPPAYPLLLAMLWKFAPSFPDNVPLFLGANAVLLALTALGVAWLARSVLGWSRSAAAAGAIVATLSTPLLMLAGLVLSEPLFAALLLPTLVGAERIARDECGSRDTVLVSLSLGALALVRTHALALALALLLVLAFRRRWRTAALCAAVTFATIAPWEVWLAVHAGGLGGPLQGSYGPYASWLADGARDGGVSFVARTVMLNAREVFALLADHFSLGDGRIPRDLGAALALLLLGVGAWRVVRRAPVLVTFVAIYTAVLLVWPFTPWRFVYAVWPLVIVLCGEAVAAVVANRALLLQPSVSQLGAACALLVAAGAARDEVRAYANRSWRQPGAAATAQIAPLVRWVGQRTAMNDVVAVDGEQLVYLFTGRRAVPVAPFTAREYVRPRTAAENAASLRALIRDYPVRFVATISPAIRASGEIVVRESASAPGDSTAAKLVQLAPLPGGEVFRVDRGGR